MLRHADPARDGAACAAIYAPSVTDGVASFETEAPSAGEMARRIERSSRTHPWLICERDGEVAGYAYGCAHRERAAYRWAGEVSVYVDSRRHRGGVGRELYAALLGLLDLQGLWTVCAGITLPNPPSVALHEAMGFQPVGVYRAIGYKFGAWHDVGWWQLRLPGAGGEPAEPRGPQQLDQLPRA
jgi:phosphinothricin acetyltransferase